MQMRGVYNNFYHPPKIRIFGIERAKIDSVSELTLKSTIDEWAALLVLSL